METAKDKQRGFTLIELLVVMSIVGVLATTVIVTLNPAELIAQSRDSVRISDLSTINSALGIYNTDVRDAYFGTSTVVYTSLPDTASDCSNQNPALPTLTPPWTYNCVSSSTIRNTDGTGWIPVNFNQISFGSPLPILPLDPANVSQYGLYYTYVPAWELTSVMQSTKYQQINGPVYTTGPQPGVTPTEVLTRGAATSTPGGGGGSGILSTSTSVFYVGWYSPPAVWPADNWSGFDIGVRVQDASGTPISGVNVTFHASDSRATFCDVAGDWTGTTVGDGSLGYACTVRSGTVPGGTDVTFTAILQQGSNPPITFNLQNNGSCADFLNCTEADTIGPINFTAPEDPDQSTITRNTNDVPADGYGQVRLVLTAKDAGGNPVPHVLTYLAYPDGLGGNLPLLWDQCWALSNGGFSQNCEGGGSTNVNGKFTFFVYSTTPVAGGYINLTMGNNIYPTPTGGGTTATGGWTDFNFGDPATYSVGHPTVSINFTDPSTYAASSFGPYGYLKVIDSDGKYPEDQRINWGIDPFDQWVELWGPAWFTATGTVPFHLTASPGGIGVHTLTFTNNFWSYPVIATTSFEVTP